MRVRLACFPCRALVAVYLGLMLLSGGPPFGLAPASESPLTARAADGDLVISEVFGGGVPSSAVPWDFVELFNPGPESVPLSGWSVQYAGATGNSWESAPLRGVIPSGGSYLVQQGKVPHAAAPKPNANGLADMGSTAGKVALVRGLDRLTCRTATECDAETTIVDLVGFGGASAFEGSAPVPVPTAGQAIRRAAGGADSDNNAADFTAVSADPNANAETGPACTLTAPPIHQLQGAAHRSWHEGCAVEGVTGTVMAVQADGFFLQSPMEDGDAATSEGIFVAADPLLDLPTVAVGDQVSVEAGTLLEVGSSTNLTSTRIEATELAVTPEAGTPITPVTIGTAGRLPPAAIWDPARGEDVEAATSFDPATVALDFYESLEGMLVDVADPVVVGPTSDYGEVVVLASGGAGVAPMSAHGGPLVAEEDPNPERIILDDDLLVGTARPPMPAAKVGDGLAGACCIGVVDYGSEAYRVLVTEIPTLVSGGLAREATEAAGAGELAVATFNVANLDPSDGPEKFAALAEIIVSHLGSPDLIAVEEIQDRSGPALDRVVEATATWAMLSDAIVEARGPCYEFRQINPLDDQDGGEGGGNIRQGFLFRTDRGLAFVDRAGGDATTPVEIVAGPSLSVNPGRIAPRNDAFADADPAPGIDFSRSRKPLVGEFVVNGERLFVIANHLNSKLPDGPMFGREQPPDLASEPQRIAQAQVIRLFVDELLDADAEAKVIVLGDLNEFAFAPAVEILTDGGDAERDLTNVVDALPESERYTYVFTGNAQAIDHILVSASLSDAVNGVDVVHVNAEFPNAVSDHDPLVVRLALLDESAAATPVASACA